WVDGLHRVAVSFAADVRVLAPRSQLTRVVSNVLRNALQATQETHQIRVGVVRVSGLARVVVDDAGPGVLEAERDRVFQQGYTTRSDGSGYGLAYVRRVVSDELRGRVWCEDSDLGGARFVIELPSFEPE
ncbi:MAG TPA: ATP-binding protein, partial [Kofleriaceae bacterium]|nr:ATP-binding protein [Kofleriaceae bacterium]